MEKTLLVIATTAAVFGVFGVWSAFNPSYFTIKKFGVTAEDQKLIQTGMLMAVGAILITIIISALVVYNV